MTSFFKGTASRSRSTMPGWMRRAFAPSRRGRRECRVSVTPVASCVKTKTHELVTTGEAGSTRHSLRNGFNGLLRALLGDRALLPPSPARCESIVADLNASVGASGPHGFAVRVQHASSFARPRPPHPAATSVTTRTPLSSRRDGTANASDLALRSSGKERWVRVRSGMSRPVAPARYSPPREGRRATSARRTPRSPTPNRISPDP
jgi:hypothetical protein